MRCAVLIAVCAAASGCVARYLSLQRPEYADDPVRFFPLGNNWQIEEPLFPGDAGRRLATIRVRALKVSAKARTGARQALWCRWLPRTKRIDQRGIVRAGAKRLRASQSSAERIASEKAYSLLRRR